MKIFTTLTRICLAAFLMLAGLPCNLFAQFVAKQVTASNGLVVPFLEYKPATHDASAPTKKYPVIIFLHGGGECNTNLSLTPAPPDPNPSPVWALRYFGPNDEIRSGHNMSFSWNGQTEEFIVLQPMARSISNPWPTQFIDAMIDYGTNTLKGDVNRIYLTGHSFGGAGVFNYLNSSSANALKLAAAAPISCWNIALNSNGANYVSTAKLPIWALHAANDSVAFATMTTTSINTLNAVNPVVKPLSTIWPTGYIQSNAHSHAPLYVYDLHLHPYLEDAGINIYEWFLGQNKSLLPNVLPVANAGPDQAIPISPGTTTLNGTGSSDADGIVRYLWKQVSGPKSITISNTYTTSTAAAASNASKSITGLTLAGTYEFELTVVDARAGFSKDTVKITVGTPPPGKAVNFTATGARIIAGNVAELVNASAFTVEAYVKYDGTVTDWSNAEACIARNYITSTDRVKLTIDKATNSVHFTVANGTDVKGYTASNVVSPNTWYHIAGVFDGAQAVNTNRLKIYINGVSQTLTFTGTIPATTSGSSPSYIFGGEPSASRLTSIDEVRVWETALSGSTIDAWKSKLLGNCHPNFSSLAVYWPLDNDANPAQAAAGLGTSYPSPIFYGVYVPGSIAFDTVPCPPGKAVNFTATGARIIAGNVTELVNASAFTVEAYVKYDGTVTDWSNAEACIFRTLTSTTDRVRLSVDKATNSLHFVLANGADVKGYTASNVVSANTWYQVAAVFDGTQTGNASRLKIYVNGIQQTLTFTGTIPATTSGSSPSYIFGGEPSASRLTSIDEVRVWETALSGSTIDAWKSKLLGNCHPNFSSLTVYWPLDNDANPAQAAAALGTSYPSPIFYGVYVGSTQATAASGCGSRIAQPPLTSEPEDKKASVGKLYPNPTKGLIQLQLKKPISKSATVNVSDMIGRYFYRNKRPLNVGNNRVSINIASLPTGTYIIEVLDGKKIIEKYKVLKQ